jgi:hypothetical protein
MRRVAENERRGDSMLSVYGDFERACNERNAAIDRRAAQLVRNGEAPWVAISKAARRVAQRDRHVVVPGIDVEPDGPAFGVMGRVAGKGPRGGAA